MCAIYGRRKSKSVDTARLEMFQEIYSLQKTRSMEKMKGLDGSTFPPCKKTLAQKIKRVNLVASVYCNSVLKDPLILDPVENGWILVDNDSSEDGEYRIKWFEGNYLPNQILKKSDFSLLEVPLEENVIYSPSSDESDIEAD